MRRAVDVIVCVIAGVLLVPVVALLALLVWVSMGRPILFRQERSGLHGRIFTVVKFRTMRAPVYPGEGDAVRTPTAGRFLRSSSLDELPQLWNIVRGDMGLIGPRPTLPEQVARYTDHERGRLAVRPGLTGWAQINGRNAISWPARIELDLWYVSNQTLWVDLTILFRTVLRLIRPRDVVGIGGHNPDYPHPTTEWTMDNISPYLATADSPVRGGCEPIAIPPQLGLHEESSALSTRGQSNDLYVI